MIRAGKLDRTVTVERATFLTDANGTPVATWTQYVLLRAEIVEANTGEEQREHGASTKVAITFRTHFYAGITVADRLTYDGRAFDIKTVTEIGRRAGLELNAERLGP